MPEPVGSGDDTDDATGGHLRSAKPVVGGRSESRERAVHLLYEAEMKGSDPIEVAAAQIVAPDRYTAELVTGVARERERLDGIIGDYAKGWTIARMPVMDVVVLRMAIFELTSRSDVPRGVVLSEAVDLASRYGTDDSPRFVNGVLAAIAAEVRPD